MATVFHYQLRLYKGSKLRKLELGELEGSFHVPLAKTDLVSVLDRAIYSSEGREVYIEVGRVIEVRHHLFQTYSTTLESFRPHSQCIVDILVPKRNEERVTKYLESIVKKA